MEYFGLLVRGWMQQVFILLLFILYFFKIVFIYVLNYIKCNILGPIRNIGDIFTTSKPNYDDIDHPAPHTGHPSQGGYNISTAQQI